MEEILDFLKWAGDKWGINAIIIGLWVLDRWRMEQVLDKSLDRYIQLGQTTADTLATMMTLLKERLPRNHD
jgi:hypothetical protein